MDITIRTELQNRTATLQVEKLNLTPVWADRFRRYGQVVVEFGGTVTPLEGVESFVEFELPPRSVTIPSGLPVRQSFHAEQYPGDALADVTQAWEADIRSRIATALQELADLDQFRNPEGTRTYPLES